MFRDIFEADYLFCPLAVAKRIRYTSTTSYIEYRNFYIFGLRVARWN